MAYRREEEKLAVKSLSGSGWSRWVGHCVMALKTLRMSFWLEKSRSSQRLAGVFARSILVLAWLVLVGLGGLRAQGIVVDATSSVASAGKVSSLSWSHSVGSGSDRLLVVGLSLRKHDASVDTLTYGGGGSYICGYRYRWRGGSPHRDVALDRTRHGQCQHRSLLFERRGSRRRRGLVYRRRPDITTGYVCVGRGE